MRLQEDAAHSQSFTLIISTTAPNPETKTAIVERSGRFQFFQPPTHENCQILTAGANRTDITYHSGL
jgi:hypothetical protein